MSTVSTKVNASMKTNELEHIEDKLFINGEFVPSVSGKKFDVYNPTTEKLAASVYEANAEDVDLAVKAAQTAFPAWAALSAADRIHYLDKLADAIEANGDELAYLEAITMGKPSIDDCTLSTFRLLRNKAKC